MRFPVLIIVKIRDEGKKFSLYLFLPLIFLLLLPLFLIGIVIYALMTAFRVDREARKTALALIVYLPRLVSASWGTEIDIHSEKSDVTVFVK